MTRGPIDRHGSVDDLILREFSRRLRIYKYRNFKGVGTEEEEEGGRTRNTTKNFGRRPIRYKL